MHTAESVEIESKSSLLQNITHLLEVLLTSHRWRAGNREANSLRNGAHTWRHARTSMPFKMFDKPAAGPPVAHFFDPL